MEPLTGRSTGEMPTSPGHSQPAAAAAAAPFGAGAYPPPPPARSRDRPVQRVQPKQSTVGPPPALPPRQDLDLVYEDDGKFLCS